MVTKRVLCLIYKGKVLFRVGIGKNITVNSFKLEIDEEAQAGFSPVYTLPD